MGKSEESMPRKSKHGTDIARWGHHEEMKEDRRKGRNKSKQKWKKEIKKDASAKDWVLKQCKFAGPINSPIDLTNLSDRDLGPAYTPEQEEDALLGEEEIDENYAYKDGYQNGLRGFDTSDNPYRTDTELGKKKFNEWTKGFSDAKQRGINTNITHSQ